MPQAKTAARSLASRRCCVHYLQGTYSLDDAKRLHKQQWIADAYAAALDVGLGADWRVSQTKRLEVIQLRSNCITERSATLNNPHVTKTHLVTSAGSNRAVGGPDWAAGVR